VDGTTTIALADVQDMYFSNEAGTTFTRGDVNGDGTVNITDVTLLISAVLSSDYSAIIEQAADMNGDGAVNITDVTLLISSVMGN